MILGNDVRKSLGPYQLVRRLGAGGMAEVYLAIAHGASGFAREVAIKTLRSDVLGDPKYERALIREATLAARLQHRNLVYVHGFGVDEGMHYMVMEYVDGGDLADAHLPEPLALHVASEVALGLAHLHDARDERGLPLGLVHRDLSPSNILVSTTGDVKLGDFGIAKATALEDRTEGGARRGNYAYMAPEQLAGDPVTAATDQFGLGTTLVELITGVRWFLELEREGPFRTMSAILAGRRCLDGIAADVAAIVTRATTVKAADRYGSMSELRVALEAVRTTREPAGAPELAAWVTACLARRLARRSDRQP